MKILLLEDDRETASAVEKGLAHEGHDVSVAHDVGGCLALLEAGSFDAAILDVMVPGGSGYDVLEELRSRRHPTRVLLLTARGSVEDRVKGLDHGADDYLVKPFAFSELAARVRALSRRDEPLRLRLDELELDLASRCATVDGKRIDLTPTQFALLGCLMRAEGQAVSRPELLREVWGYDFDPGTNVVDVHVNRLRRKLEDAGLQDRIQTLRRQGYALR